MPRYLPAITFAILLVLVVVTVIMVIRGDHTDAVRNQHIADCVVATADTWAQCAKIVGGVTWRPGADV